MRVLSKESVESLDDSSETVRSLTNALLDQSRVSRPDHSFRVSLLGDPASGKRRLLNNLAGRTSSKDAELEDACMDSLCGCVILC
jgi:hypothetical protein